MTPHKSSALTRGKRVRARLRYAALTRMPLHLSRGRLALGRSVNRLHLTQRSVSIPGMPEALDGLRITHLSDLHVGELITPARLPAIIQAANSLGGDLIAVTGDFVDLSLGVLDEVIDALGQLKAPLGVYMVPGNHDYLEDGPALVRRMREAGLGLLVNQRVGVEHRDTKMEISGIDFAHKPRHLARLVRDTVGHPRKRENGDDQFRLLLAHHPHAFDSASRHGVHLTLSGHTHGGQVMLSRGHGRKGSFGLASFGFRYPQGLYRRGHSYLYVTSGVGSWFPLRLRCPAEIACLTLRSQPITSEEASLPGPVNIEK